MTTAIIDAIYAPEGAPQAMGARLSDLTANLSTAARHDGPPVADYRLMVRERAWLRRLDMATRDEPEAGGSVALFSTEPDEPLDSAPAREARLAIAGIIPQSVWAEAQP